MSQLTGYVRRAVVLCTIVLLGMLASRALATVSVSPIFTSDMVLQRNTTVPVFGTADPAASVTVAFQNQNLNTVADNLGKWQVNLSSMAASTSPSAMTITSPGSPQVVFNNVQVGEVWLCSGQSNMGKPLSYADGGSAAANDAVNHNI